MSFVARRYGSAGFVFDPPAQVRQRSDESGVIPRAPFVVAVGVEDDVAFLAAHLAKASDVGFLRVAHGPAACRAIPDARPTVVAIAMRLWADERNAVVEAASRVGAVVVELPRQLPPEEQALLVLRACFGEDRALAS